MGMRPCKLPVVGSILSVTFLDRNMSRLRYHETGSVNRSEITQDVTQLGVGAVDVSALLCVRNLAKNRSKVTSRDERIPCKALSQTHSGNASGKTIWRSECSDGGNDHEVA